MTTRSRQGVLEVDDGGQRVVVDDDGVERVAAAWRVVGHDDGDGVADVAGLVDGDGAVVAGSSCRR